MDETPAWTRDIQSYTSTRWIWRKEVTTVTWWPLQGSTAEPLHHQPTDPKAPPQTAKSPDWQWVCGQSNWAWRRACYASYVPKGMDPPPVATNTGVGSATVNTNDERISDNKPSAPSSSSANPADAKASGQGAK